MRRLQRVARRRAERGAAALEFALVFPIVVLLILAAIQYSYHYWALQTASASAREAARRLIVGTDPTCTVADARTQVQGPTVGTAPPQVTYRYDNLANQPERGVLVTVTVRFQSLDFGLLPLPNGGVVEQTATNRVENVPYDPLDCTTP